MLKEVYSGKTNEKVELTWKADVTLESDGEGGLYVSIRSDDPKPEGQSMIAQVPREKALPALKALMEEMEAEVRGEVK
jgi:hypothetical protein